MGSCWCTVDQVDSAWREIARGADCLAEEDAFDDIRVEVSGTSGSWQEGTIVIAMELMNRGEVQEGGSKWFLTRRHHCDSYGTNE